MIDCPHVVGECSDCNTAARSMLRDEAETYNDILQINFTDTYRNLTLKTLTSFKWVHTKCAHVQFYLKIDDDVYLNLHKILWLLNANRDKLKNALAGERSKTVWVVRDKQSPYYVSRDNMPGFLHPQFCYGTTYLASNTAIETLLRIAGSTPLLPLEDVSMGILAKKSGLVQMLDIPDWRTRDVHICPIEYTVFELNCTEIERIWTQCNHR